MTMALQTAPRTYYDVLGVPRNAKLAYIRRRYLTLAQEVHPDRFSDLAERARKAEEFKAVNEAWEVLSDRVQRGQYDASLDGGTDFRPAEGKGKTAEAIFGDAKRFEFNWTSNFPESLRGLVLEQLKSVKEFDHRVIATFHVSKSTVGRSPLTAPCGESQSVYLVLTNMNLEVGIVGKSETQQGNTRYTMTYSRISSLYLGAIERLDISLCLAGDEGSFTIRINAPESAFSGVEFECQGSPFVFLWVADLFDIRTTLGVKSADPKSPAAPLFMAAIGVVAGLWIASLGEPFTIVAGVALAVIFAIHGAVESRRVADRGRLIEYCQRLVGRAAPAKPASTA
jgi:DnaJ domain